jgi:hypothetical protein
MLADVYMILDRTFREGLLVNAELHYKALDPVMKGRRMRWARNPRRFYREIVGMNLSRLRRRIHV